MSTSPLPLKGVRVVELGTYAAGPICTRVLADWGADVIKIEPLSGEACRIFGRVLGAPIDENENPIFEVENANKRGIALDLKTEKGQEVIHKLLEVSDVFISNYRYKALRGLGLGYEQLSEKYPGLVYGYINGFGEKGPASDKPGYDYTAYWARGGVMMELGEPDAPPLTALAGFGDHPTGTFLVGGIVAALLKKERTGLGEKVVVSLYNSAIWNMGLNIIASYYWDNPKKSVKKPIDPLINAFQCKDGKWISLAIPEYERYWEKFCVSLEREELIDDERFNNIRGAKKNNVLLVSLIQEIIFTKNRDEWIKIWTELDIPFEVAQTFKEILVDEQALLNEYLIEVKLPNGNKAMMPTCPIKFMVAGSSPWRNAPYLGEHTKEVLLELGYSSNQIEGFKNSKIIVT